MTRPMFGSAWKLAIADPPVGAGYATVATVFQQFAEFRGHLGFIIDDQDAEMPRGRFVHGHTLHSLIVFLTGGRALECSHTEWY